MKSKPQQSARHQAGATLVEVLVAVVVLAFGVVGMAGVQYAGMKFNHSASLRSIATSLAYDLADRTRANLEACPAVGCAYETPLATTFDGAADQRCGQPLVAAGSAVALAANDVNQWKNCIENELPVGRGGSQRLAPNTDYTDQCGVTHEGAPLDLFVVEVNWNESRLNAGGEPDCVVVRTEVRPL